MVRGGRRRESSSGSGCVSWWREVDVPTEGYSLGYARIASFAR